MSGLLAVVVATGVALAHAESQFDMHLDLASNIHRAGAVWGAIDGSNTVAMLKPMSPASNFPYARCLDGSQFGVYIRPAPTNASVVSKTSWLVVLNGGGLCTHESDCTARAKTDLGTSTVWAPGFNLSSVSFMSYSDANPFRDWNMVFVPYCSGDMHSGQRTTKSNSTFGLYFAGYENVKATVKYLAINYGLNTTGNTLVWSGGSAGGVGVFSTVDLVASSLPDLRVVGAPVGGFPPDLHWSTIKGATPPEEDARTPAFAVNNALYDAVLPPLCAKALASESYKCGVPHLAYPYLSTPSFIMESITDIVIMCGFEGMPCSPPQKALLNPDVWGEINAYGHNATAMFSETVLKSTRDGFFAPNCILHTGFLLDGPIIDDKSAVTALWQWLHDPTNATSRQPSTHKYVDHCLDDKFFPPCGKHCPQNP